MSQSPEGFREVRVKIRPLLLRALQYFLEDVSEVETVTAGALEQAERQWIAIEGEANVRHLIALAAEDHCLLLLPRADDRPTRRTPRAAEIVRHLEWYDWEQRIARIEEVLEARRATVREAGGKASEDTKILWLEEQLLHLTETLFRARLGISDDDEMTGGGMACEVKPPPPGRGPGEKRTFTEALAPVRNP